jgi:hypothetical protein
MSADRLRRCLRAQSSAERLTFRAGWWLLPVPKVLAARDVARAGDDDRRAERGVENGQLGEQQKTVHQRERQAKIFEGRGRARLAGPVAARDRP